MTSRELVYAMAPFWSRFGDITHAQVDIDGRAWWEMFADTSPRSTSSSSAVGPALTITLGGKRIGWAMH